MRGIKSSMAKVAVLCWEDGSVPKGLIQLESLIGNSTNPASYPFAVEFRKIKGANIHTVLENPSPIVLKEMITQSKQLISEGIELITTSCGFNAIFQKELSDELDVPVFTSSLVLVPMIQLVTPEDGKIGIITAKQDALSEKHFLSVGIVNNSNLIILGLEKKREWSKIFSSPDEKIDLKKITQEILNVAIHAKITNPEISSFVLECTDLPPFSSLIRENIHIPVYDYLSMITFAAHSIGIFIN